MRLAVHISFLILGILVRSFGQSGTGVWDVFASGAKGDGKTIDTKAIQAAIDHCHAAGGGQVYLHNGRFISGTIVLKSDVTFHIEAGAKLIASEFIADFPVSSSAYPHYLGEPVSERALIYAENAHHIAITGRGTIDGRGDAFHREGLAKTNVENPKILVLKGCRNVQIRDISLVNAAAWVQLYQLCSNLLIDGITVDSRENPDIEKTRYATVPGRNTDGLDLVDCEQVRISNSYINSGDDAICLKSLSGSASCRDIAITNCVLTSNASGFKIGTETAGAFENITIQNCVVYDTRGEAISIMSVDGAIVNNINVANISLRNIKGTAIFVRLGNRNRIYHPQSGQREKGVLQNITISNVQGTRIGGYGCSITGIEAMPLRNIRLSDIDLRFTDGGKAIAIDNIPDKELTTEERIGEINRQVPELPKAYPSGRMFGRLPAYGFYVRHARDITLDRVKLSFDEPDIRPAIYCDDVEDLEINHLKAQGSDKMPELIRLVNVRNAVVSGSSAATPVPVFLGIYESGSKGIRLFNNHLGNVSGEKWAFHKGALKTALTNLTALK